MRQVVLALAFTLAWVVILSLTLKSNYLVEDDDEEEEQQQQSSYHRVTTVSDWRRSDLTTKCFHIEDVCHNSGRWFYKASNSTNKKQPLITIDFDYDEWLGRGWQYTKHHQVGWLPKDLTDRMRCRDSVLPNHLISFSKYNNMLGEFYAQGLYGLWQIFPTLSNLDTFLQETQMYLHLSLEKRGLLESHHAFTSAMRTNPLLDMTTLLHGTQCQCLPNLLLCGYKQEERNGTTWLLPDGIVSNKRAWNDADFSDMRNLIRKRAIDDNPFVKRDIEAFRRRIIVASGVDTNATDFSWGGWKIVGLTQRTSRRIWDRLSHVIAQCNSQFKDEKVLFVEINVESKGWSPYSHVERHAAMDALIGIHGAQMTEAIWMRPGALVVELLPYVPDGKWGDWVQTTKHPTPLGVIFDQTNLQHVGYKLQRDSAPYCENMKTKEDESACWSQHKWDGRKFLFGADKVQEIVQQFLLIDSDKCEDFVKCAPTGSNLILYNINCREEANDEVSPHHYYWQDNKQP